MVAKILSSLMAISQNVGKMPAYTPLCSGWITIKNHRYEHCSYTSTDVHE